jgi:hypothetical protein
MRQFLAMVLVCCAGCANPFAFIDNYSPHNFVTQFSPLQAQVDVCRAIKPGTAVSQVELDLRESGFTCQRTLDASSNPYLDACSSRGGFCLIVHVYYQDGVVVRCEAKGKWENEGLIDSPSPKEEFDINLDEPTASVFVPVLAKESS